MAEQPAKEGRGGDQETRRAALLASYGIAGTAAEFEFDMVAERASRLCEAPMAAVGFLMADSEWLKAAVGFERRELPRLGSFCEAALEADAAVTVIPDVRLDSRFARNPLVAGRRSVRFYAAAPVRSPEGLALGTVAIFDSRPRDLSAVQREALADLAREVESLLAARRAIADLAVAGRPNRRQLERAVEGLGTAVLCAPVGVLLAGLDGNIIEANQAFADLLGRSPEELVGLSIAAYTDPRDVDSERALIAEVFAGRRDRALREKRYLRADGSSIWALSSTVLLRGADGASRAFLSQVDSIEQRRRAEDALMETQSVFDAVVTVDGAGRVVAWNAGAERMFGRSHAEMAGRAIEEIIPEPLREAHREGLRRASRQGLARPGKRMELSALGPGGTELPVELVLEEWERAGQRYFTGVLRDLSERRALEAEISQRVNTDTLTGVASRSMLTSSLSSLLVQTAPVSVLALDVYRFGQLNITLGPSAADRVLVEIGRILQGVLRDQDVVGRVGGDEFAAVLPGASAAQAGGVASRLHEALHEASSAGRLPAVLEVRSGIAVSRSKVSEGRASGVAFRLLRNAQLALAEGSPGSVSTYRADIVRKARRRAQLHAALHKALDREKLSIAYQVQQDLESGRIVGVEALARWEDSRLGVVGPAEFIPIAEETGLIHRLGSWVLAAACQRASAWLPGTNDPFRLSVNVSPRQLGDDRIVEVVEKALGHSGFPASALTLEVTESVLTSAVPGAFERLEAISSLGVRIAVDDFGTGYSNLASLTQFPISELKIDRCFVTSLPASGSAVKVVTTILGLAQNLELNTVAEGVETLAQANVLAQLGCRVGQGYLFGRPVPAQEIDCILPAGQAVITPMHRRRSG